jgi:hypothetical protein
MCERRKNGVGLMKSGKENKMESCINETKRPIKVEYNIIM